MMNINNIDILRKMLFLNFLFILEMLFDVCKDNKKLCINNVNQCLLLSYLEKIIYIYP